MLKKAERIEDVGLESWLNERYQEQGGYAEFAKRVMLAEPKTIIAKAFGVNKGTIYSWLEIFNKEKVK